MAVRSVQDQVDVLLNRSLVEDKTRGAPSSEVEATAVLETVATTMVLQPRVALYLAHLARNALVRVLMDEIEAIDALILTIKDLGNVSYSIRTTKSLSQANAALLQIDTQGRLNLANGNFKKFSTSVNDFLEKELSKSVRRVGSKELIRPGSEAETALPADVNTLKTTHADMIDRLYSLAVGVANFSTASINSLLGVTVAYRVRQDIEAIISDLAKNQSAVQARDYTIRLIASRSALTTLGDPPLLTGPVIDTNKKIPAGLAISGRTSPAAALSTSTPGPWTLPAVPTPVISTAVGTTAPARFPLGTTDLGNRAMVFGAEVVYPITVPAATNLFIGLDGVTQLIPLNTTLLPRSMTKAEVMSAINASPGLLAVDYPVAGTGRLAIIALSGSTISVERTCLVAHTESTIDQPAVYTRSAHSLLGLTEKMTGTAGTTQMQVVVDALNAVANDLYTAELLTDGSVLLSSVDTAPGAFLSVSGLSGPDFPTTVRASSMTLSLYGVVAGQYVDPIDPQEYLSIGDSILAGGVKSYVSGFEGDSINLLSEMPTFDGSILASSALVSTWGALNSAVMSFLTDWLKTKYAQNLSYIDGLVAPLYASSTSATRNGAILAIEDLRAKLVDLQERLTAPDTLLPDGAASKEAAAFQEVRTLFLERKYDRALALLLKCRIREVFTLDWQTASFAGELMSAMTDFVKSSVVFPNLAADEGSRATAVLE